MVVTLVCQRVGLRQVGVKFRHSHLFVLASAIVGHSIQEEVGLTGDQTGSGGPGREHGIRGHPLGHTFPCKTRNLFE